MSQLITMGVRSGLAALLLAAGIATVAAQEPSRSLAPADSAALLLGVARDLEARGRTEVAETLYRYIRDRFTGTLAAAAADGELSRRRTTRVERSGRAELITWGTIYGTWLGVAIPAALGSSESGAYGAGLLLGGPIGFMLPKAVLGQRAIGAGQARAITFGSLWGTSQALGWRSALHLGERRVVDCFPDGGGQTCYDYYTDSDEAPFTAAIVGGAAGIATGLALARRPIAIGTAAAAQFGGLWGSWFGFATGVLLDTDDDARLAATLIGGNVGLAGAAVLAARHDVSAGRPWLISAGGVAGLAAGLGFDLLFEVDDEKTAILLPALGSAAGLVAGTIWTGRAQGGTVREARGEAVESGALFSLDLRRGRLAGGAPHVQPAAFRRLASDGRVAWSPAVKIPVLALGF